MSTTQRAEENKRKVDRLTEVVNGGDLDVLDEIFAENVTEHTPQGEMRGREATKELFSQLIAAFPDRSVTLNHMIAEIDTVSTRVTWSATHEGEYQGIEPTGNEVEFSVMEFYRLEDGKIAERWIQPDQLGLMQQLGVLEQV